jgi:hypothetical protein
VFDLLIDDGKAILIRSYYTANLQKEQRTILFFTTEEKGGKRGKRNRQEILNPGFRVLRVFAPSH